MNLLPLETLRAAIGYHPFHFWGLANATAPIRSNCNDALYQYAWQDAQQIGRADMLAAIETASYQYGMDIPTLGVLVMVIERIIRISLVNYWKTIISGG